MAMNEILEALEEHNTLGMVDLMEKTKLGYSTIAVQCRKLYKRNIIKKNYVGSNVFYSLVD